MTGLTWYEVGESEYIQKILDALESFKNYLRATNQMEQEGGMLCYGLFTNENEVLSRTYHEVKAQNGEEELELVDVSLVGDVFPNDVIKQLREGKWLLYWMDILSFSAWDLPILNRLFQAFKEHNCIAFLNNMIDMSECALEAIKGGLGQMGFELDPLT